MTDPRTRLFLITPREIDAEAFALVLDEALAAGDVASLLIATQETSEDETQKTAERLVPIAQRHGVAALVADDTRIAGRSKADGIHIAGEIEDLKNAVERFHPNNIVGAGGLESRHDAMSAAEAGADYVFFGRLDGDAGNDAHPTDIDLGNWWVEMFEPPCVVMAGDHLASIDAVLSAGTDFIGLRDAIWRHPDGAAAAIKAANARIDAAAGGSS